MNICGSILIVEDEPIIRRGIASFKYFESLWNFNGSGSENGEQVIGKIQRRSVGYFTDRY